MKLIKKITVSSLLLGLALASGCGGDETATDDLAGESAAVTAARNAVQGLVGTVPFAGGIRYSLTTPGQPVLTVDIYTATRAGQRAVVTLGGRSVEVLRGTGSRLRDALAALPGAQAGVDALTLQLGTGFCNRYTGAYQAHQSICDAWDSFWA